MSAAGSATANVIPYGISPRVFQYHADTSPFGGALTIGGGTVLIETMGSASISHAGGHVRNPGGASSVAGISVSQAHSEITASPTAGWTTVVTSEVCDLDILGIVKAKQLTCSMTVTHPAASSPSYPAIDFTGCTYVGLTIKGVPVDPTCNLGQYARTVPQVLAKECCWLDDFGMQSKVDSQVSKLLTSCPGWLSGRYDWVTKPNQWRARGHVICSLVTGFNPDGGYTTYGHVLEVPGFGYLYFGELTVSHGSFGVTMLRVELSDAPGLDKTPINGTVAIATAHTNGSSAP